MAKPIQIGHASDLHVTTHDICSFYSDNWPRKIALSNYQFSQWQFESPPMALMKNHSVVAVSGNKLLAVMGVTPSTFRCDRQKYQGAELTTWVVSPEARGKGIGRKILDFLQANYDILLGAGISDAALPLYMSAGFTYLAKIPRFFFVSDFKKTSTFAEITDQEKKLTSLRQSSAPSSKFTYQTVKPNELNGLEQYFCNFSGFERSYDRLLWRFEKHPVFQYHAAVIKDDETEHGEAGVVYRVETVGGINFIHVVEIFGDFKHFNAALHHIEQITHIHDAAFVDLTGTCSTITAAARLRGWTSVLDDPLIKLPSLFFPIEYRNPATTSVTVWGNACMLSLFNLSNLHLTRMDLDLDRPTIAWYEQNGL